jgi:hypothetical protein
VSYEAAANFVPRGLYYNFTIAFLCKGCSFKIEISSGTVIGKVYE